MLKIFLVLYVENIFDKCYEIQFMTPVITLDKVQHAMLFLSVWHHHKTHVMTPVVKSTTVFLACTMHLKNTGEAIEKPLFFLILRRAHTCINMVSLFDCCYGYVSGRVIILFSCCFYAL